MRRGPFRIFALVFSLVAAQGFTLSTQDLNIVSFVNNLSSGSSIDYIFFSPSESKFWGPDLLAARDSLANGSSIDCYLMQGQTKENYDLLVIDDSGRVYQMSDIEFVEGSPKSIRISERNRVNKNTDGMQLTEILFTNKTNETLKNIFLAPGDTKAWGIDYLYSVDSLPPGGTWVFRVPVSDSGFNLDFLAISAANVEYKKSVKTSTKASTVELDLTPQDHP